MEKRINNPTTHSGYKCIFCGQELLWSSCENASDRSDNYPDDDDSVIWYFDCPYCGCEYEIYEPTNEEKEKFYNEHWNL